MNSRLCGRLILLLLILLGGTPTEDIERQQIINQLKKGSLDALKNKPMLDRSRIEDVFSIRREEGNLVLHTLVPPTRYFEERRAELSGLPYPAVILCRELSIDIPQFEFDFTMEDWSVALSHGALHVRSAPGEFVLEKAWSTPHGDYRIVYSQDGSHVNLILTGNDAIAAPMSRLMANTFDDLRRAHPIEVEEFIRPLLREIRQEAALVPDAAAAWQVLIDDWPVNEADKTGVGKFLPALDDDNYLVRAKAANNLFQLGRGAATYLWRMDRRGLSVEQRVRLDQIISRYCGLPDSAADQLHNNPHFLVDCLDCEDAIARRLALARLRKVAEPTIDFDINLQGSARIAAVNGVRDKLFPASMPTNPVLTLPDGPTVVPAK